MARIIAFAGSSRADSLNKKLVQIAAEGARGAGAEVTLIDLKDYPLPLYDGDCESELGLPENAKKLRAILLPADGLLISSPEYNGSISGVLKNIIDWLSRPVAGEPTAFRGKIVGLMSTSPGVLGGLRGLVHVRSILMNLGALVLPEQIAVPKAAEVFDSQGKLKDGALNSSVQLLGARVAKMASAVRPVLAEFEGRK
jgi:NAD(P)H-dependent FMN reductase